jgi:hypothetical protein
MNVDSTMTLSSPERSDVASTPTPSPSELNPDALFAKELYYLLSSLEAANPGLRRAIVCLLSGMTTKGKSKSKNKKVGDFPHTGIRNEKSIKCKDKKSGAMGKTPAAV